MRATLRRGLSLLLEEERKDSAQRGVSLPSLSVKKGHCSAQRSPPCREGEKLLKSSRKWRREEKLLKSSRKWRIGEDTALRRVLPLRV